MRSLRDWWLLLAINAVASLLVHVAFGRRLGGATWGFILQGAWPGFLVSTTISVLCLLALPRLTSLADRDTTAWRRWGTIAATLVALAAVGSTAAVGALTVAGQIEDRRAFVLRLRDTMKIAVGITVILGLYTARHHALRARLDRATLALRTKERDEAEARREASEAQLAALESRVNPHFLFNTLNSIAALTRQDAAKAERMTTQLAMLMRSSLDQRVTPLVPLEQEVQAVRDYLEIEQVRFGDRLRYEIRIVDAGHALVPRLALQTLVENAVKYAVSARRTGASVLISARLADRRVYLDVTDDGPGFDASCIPEGHGLALIRDRLRRLFGDDAALSVVSNEGRTNIGLSIPIVNPHA